MMNTIEISVNELKNELNLQQDDLKVQKHFFIEYVHVPSDVSVENPEFMTCLAPGECNSLLDSVYSMEFAKNESLCIFSTHLGETRIINMSDVSIQRTFTSKNAEFMWKGFCIGNHLGVNSLRHECSTLHIFDIEKGLLLWSRSYDFMFTMFLWHEMQFLATTSSGHVVSFNLVDFEIDKDVIPAEIAGEYTCILACKNEKHFVLGSYNGNLTFIDKFTWKEVFRVGIPGLWTIVEYKQDCFYCGGLDGTIYQVENQTVKNRLNIHKDRISNLIFKYGLLYSFALDADFVILDTRTNTIVKKFRFGNPGGGLHMARQSSLCDVIYFISGSNLFQYRIPAQITNFEKLKSKLIDAKFTFETN